MLSIIYLIYPLIKNDHYSRATNQEQSIQKFHKNNYQHKQVEPTAEQQKCMTKSGFYGYYQSNQSSMNITNLWSWFSIMSRHLFRTLFSESNNYKRLSCTVKSFLTCYHIYRIALRQSIKRWSSYRSSYQINE